MKKLMVTIFMIIAFSNSVQAYSDYSDYVREDRARRQYEQERFDRMMENNRCTSEMSALYYSQQRNSSMHRPYIPTTDYSYNSTYTISRPLETFGR